MNKVLHEVKHGFWVVWLNDEVLHCEVYGLKPKRYYILKFREFCEKHSGV